MNHRLIVLLVLSVQIANLFAQNVYSRVESACAGKSLNLDCTSANPDINNTVLLDEVITGIRSDPSKGCAYSTGDCYEINTSGVCGAIGQKCPFILFSSNLSSCGNQKYEYFQVRYSCVPESFADNQITHDISQALTPIRSSFGMIISPNYPKYTQVVEPVIQKLIAPEGKSFKVWINKLKINGKASNASCSDYLKISDTTGVFEYCGTIQPVSREFCSNEIYIAYKAATPVQTFPTFTGFQLYFEEIQPDSGCPTVGTAVYPSEPSTTTTQKPSPTTQQVMNFAATPREEFKLCRGETKTFTPPTAHHVFYLEDLNYGVSYLNSNCPDLSSLSCAASQQSPCTMTDKCTISFRANENALMPECGDKNATFLFGTYRYIPINSLSKGAVCQDNHINADAWPHGVLTSQSYPTFEANMSCQMTLSVSDPKKVFRFYVTDLYIDPPHFVSDAESRCEKSFVRFSDKATSKTYCNFMTNSRTYSYTSCSNQVTIDYRTSSIVISKYKGFRAFYEVIDKQFECPEIQTSSTKQTITITPRDNNTYFSSILTTGNQKCELPFFYQQGYHSNCINADFHDYWCSVSGNADVDATKSKCKMGFTDTVEASICARQTRKLSCPSNYLIFILSSEFVVTDDKTCDGTPVCTSPESVSSTTCSGSNICSIPSSALLVANCQNRNADFLRLKFTCIPDNVAGLKSYDICDDVTRLEPRGFITSPGFPEPVVDRVCASREFTFDAKSGTRTTSPKLISVYIVSFSVGSTAMFGQKCQNSFFQVNDDDKSDKLCGNLKTSVLYRGCSDRFRPTLNVANKATSGFKLYYEVDSNSCDPGMSTNDATETWSTTREAETQTDDSASTDESTGHVYSSTFQNGWSTSTSEAQVSVDPATTSNGGSVEPSFEPTTDSLIVGTTAESTNDNDETTPEASETSEAHTQHQTVSAVITVNITSNSSSHNNTTTTIRTSIASTFAPNQTDATVVVSTDQNDNSTHQQSTATTTSTTSSTRTSTTTTEATTTTPNWNWTLKTYLIIIIPAVVSSILTGLFMFVLIKCCCTKKNRVTPSRSRRRRASSLEMDEY